jgi:hypothetical protein
MDMNVNNEHKSSFVWPTTEVLFSAPEKSNFCSQMNHGLSPRYRR